MEPTARKLIDRILSNDRPHEAWGTLVGRYDPWLYSCARRLTTGFSIWRRDGVEPEDLAQLVWTRLCQHENRALDNFEEKSEGAWRSYLLTILRNIVRDILRQTSNQSTPRIMDADEETIERRMKTMLDPRPDPEKRLETKELVEKAERALHREWIDRPTRDRDIVIWQLNRIDGTSAAKIAAMGGFSLTNKGVESVLERATKVIQKYNGGPGARSRDLDPGQPNGFDRPAGNDHWSGPNEVMSFVVDHHPFPQRKIDHVARCEDCRRVLARQTEKLLADPTDEELRAYAAAVGATPARVSRILTHVVGYDIEEIENRTDFMREPTRGRRRPVIMALAAVLLLVFLSPMLRNSLTSDFEHPLTTLEGDFPLARAAAPLRLAQDFAVEDPTERSGDSIPQGIDEHIDDLERDLLIRVSSESDLSRREKVSLNNAIGHLNLARDYLTSAEDAYRDVLDLESDNAVALVGSAIVAYRRWETGEGEADERAEFLRRADELLRRVGDDSPHFALALFNRIYVAVALDEEELARDLMLRYDQLADARVWGSSLPDLD